MKKTREFINDGSRYMFDTGLCSSTKGYAQIDTSQDAWYFGTWANPTERKIVSYSEGDLDITECESDEEFVAEMRKLQEWNHEMGYKCKIDPGFSNELELKAAFVNLGLGDMLH